MKTKFYSAAIAAILLATASVGVSAFAAETTDETASAVEETSEDNGAEGKPNETVSTSVSEDENTENVDMEQFMTITGQLSGKGTITPNDNSAPDYYGDPHYDTDGNATLIESEQIIYNTEEMQFIAVTTKDGHVFYVLINYSAENGQDNVYFLNKVDDFDLYALLYAGDENAENITPEQALQAAENANGRVKPDGETDTGDTNETSESSEATSEEVEQPKKNNMNMNNVYLIFGGIALIGAGAAGYFVMKKKNNGKKNAAQSDLDYGEDDNEIVEEDDYPDYLDENNDDE